MKQLQLTLETITPLFLGGADARGDPELRGAPFRGQLHYWWRALVGARQSLKPRDLLKEEGSLLGSTEAGSPVTLRVAMLPGRAMQIGQRYMLPHKVQSQQYNEKSGGIPSRAFVENQTFTLGLILRPGLPDFPIEVLQALALWVNLGGIGKRARRGFGSLRISGSRAEGIEIPKSILPLLEPALPADGQALAGSIHSLLQVTLGSNITASTAPIPSGGSKQPPSDYPGFEGGRWIVLVCQEPFRQPLPPYRLYETAMRDFWIKHLRADGIRHPKAYGWVGNSKRRASPFHLHLAQSQQGLHLIFTAFNALPRPYNLDPKKPNDLESWEMVTRLLESCRASYKGVHFS